MYRNTVIIVVNDDFMTAISLDGLLQLLFGRNGDAPMPVIAPATPAECFDMAIEASRLHPLRCRRVVALDPVEGRELLVEYFGEQLQGFAFTRHDRSALLAPELHHPGSWATSPRSVAVEARLARNRGMGSQTRLFFRVF